MKINDIIFCSKVICYTVFIFFKVLKPKYVDSISLDVEDLKEILLNVEPRLQPIPLIRRHVSRFVDGADMDEVYPKLWLGDWFVFSCIFNFQNI